MTDTKADYVDNGDFYTLYAGYLAEPRVRNVHDKVLKAVKLNPAFDHVIDLGCGKGNEFFNHGGTPEMYVGVDQNADVRQEKNRITEQLDYRDPDVIKSRVDEHKLTGIVSLYSAEITQPNDKNDAFYEKLFQDNPEVNAIYVPGFYYEHAKGQKTVGEAGGLTSYQTSGTIERPDTKAFHETRVEIPCPSTLFGEDVVEVHRLLQRPGHFDSVSADALMSLAPPGYAAETRMAQGYASEVAARAGDVRRRA